jgi:signal transduction histidine kinase
MRHLWISGLLLLTALTFFFFKSQTIDPQQHYVFVTDLRRLQELESVLKADVLKTRFAIDANYDRLVAHGEQLRLKQMQLRRELPSVIPVERQPLRAQFRDIEVALAQQATLVEHFKAQNAVLQNSLRYFPLIAQTSLIEFATQAVDQDLQTHLHDLLELMLLYNLNAREDLKPQVQQRIEQVQAALPYQIPEVQSRLENILLHARAIVRLKGEVTQVIAEMMDLPVGPALDRFTTAYDGMQTRILQEASFYRWLLYGNCLGLLAFVLVLYRTRYRAKLLTIANINLEKTVDERTQTLRQTLDDLQQSQMQLIQAEKMAGLGQLVAGIAHEINNPVSFIYGNIAPTMNYVSDLMGLLQRYQTAYPDPSLDIQDYLTKIDWEFTQTDLPRTLTSMQTGADRIREIVLSLRNFSRLDEADKKYANLNDGIASTLLLLQHRLKAQPDRVAIQVVQNLAEIPQILCYPGQINQVLMNLIANAIDALEEAIAVDPQGHLTPQIQIHTALVCHESAPLLRIEIADNGTGMSPEIQQKLFDPFFTTKPVGKGTGLGTSISYQIMVDRHGGTIRCESTLGEGTSFILELPALIRESRDACRAV